MDSGKTPKVRSPLTQGPSSLLSEVSTWDICRLYRRRLDIDVSRHFIDIERLEYRECVQSGARFFFPFCPGDKLFYQEISKNSWYYLENKEEYRYAGTWLGDAISVLDVGCGIGKFAGFVPHARFVGLELSALATEAGRASSHTILDVSLAEHARANPNGYDAVTAFQVLEHVTDPVEFLRAMVSCARPGGFVVIAVPADDGALGASVNNTLNLPPHHLTHWTDRALNFVMSMMGLIGVGLYHLPLDPEHEVEAITQFFARAIRGAGFHKKLIRNGLADRLFLAVVRVMAKGARRGIAAPSMRGHTVVAIGRKPAEEGAGMAATRRDKGIAHGLGRTGATNLK